MSDDQKGVKRPQSWNALWAEALCEQDVELTAEKKTHIRTEWSCLAASPPQQPRSETLNNVNLQAHSVLEQVHQQTKARVWELLNDAQRSVILKYV